MRLTGTTARGIRTPIIRQGDDLARIVVDSVVEASASEGFALRDRDVVCVTEAVVARAQGNYVSTDEIAAEVERLFPGRRLGLVFPILSRNRFATQLKGLARGMERLTILLSYPSDEFGNALLDADSLLDSGLNPFSDVLTEADYRTRFGQNVHPFTGVDYVDYYRRLVTAEDCECRIVLANDARVILNYESDVLACDVHSRERTLSQLQGAATSGRILSLADLFRQPVSGGGYNDEYGLLGSNTATDEEVKLFPHSTQAFVESVQQSLLEQTGKHLEVMVYGDGAFKDPVARIWELADPVVSPAYTSGLEGRPAELKLKYVADNEFAHLSGSELKEAIVDCIRTRDKKAGQLGTTPRRLTDLLGSLADLVSGSGDKGTPVVLVQGYFDSLANDF